MKCTCAICHLWTVPFYIYFFILSYRRHDFRERKNVIQHEMCAVLICTIFVWNISHSKKTWTRYDKKCMYIGLDVKYQLLLAHFNETWNFSTDFRKILIYQMWWKSVQWELSCYLRTDGQTDMTNLIIAFHNTKKAPKVDLCNTVLMYMSITIGLPVLFHWFMAC